MKKLLLIAAFIFTSILSTRAQENHTLTVDFKGMKSNNGSLFVALYNKEDSFLKTPIKATILKIENKKATATFNDLPAGVYAISAFHDENNNKKMDTNFIGIPKEPIGISNDATGFMGPPKYKDAKFNISKDIALTIIVK